MTKKQIGRTIAFALVVCLLLVVMCDVFELTDDSYIPARFQTFYSLEEDSLDAVWIGTSGVDRYWISSKAYEKYGMTVYSLSSDHMASWLLTETADEILKTQTPELLIVDLRAYTQDNVTVSLADTRSRRVLDAMKPFSINRLKVAFKTMEILKRIDNERDFFDLSYLVSYIKYHPIWAEDDFSIKDSVRHKKCPYMGFFMRNTSSIKSKKNAPPKYDVNSFTELDPIAEESLYDLLDYVQEKNLEVLFVNTPGKMTSKAVARTNTVCRILDERGLKYINYGVLDENGNYAYMPDLKHVDDFYNRNHVNYYGAEKFTDVFSAYLDENYDFQDHRSDEAVKKDWDGVYDKIKEKISSWEEARSKDEEKTDK